MQSLEVVNNLVLSIKVANNTSWVIVSKINMDELAITDTGSDSKGVTCSLRSKFIGWLKSFTIELSDSSSLMVETIRMDYHSPCDMETEAGSIEIESASLSPLINVETVLAAIKISLGNASTIELSMNNASLSHRSLITSISILEGTIVEASIFAHNSGS